MSNVKKTLEEVQDYFLDYGCELLESQYVNAHTKMHYRCACGTESIINFNNFRSGKRCGCGRAGLKRLTEDELKVEVEARGYSFISSRYEEGHIIRCVCHCGEPRESSLQNLRNIKVGCRKCRDKENAIDGNLVAEYFEQRGCKLLGEYKNIYDDLDFICSCGGQSKINFERFRKIGRCLKCVPKKNIENLSGNRHYRWNPDREEIKANARFRSRCKALLRNSLKSLRQSKDDKMIVILGYSHEDLRRHIELHPNWKSVKNSDWHIDHIFPISAFLEYGITDLRLINALDNLRPLAGRENLKKNNKYGKPQFENWLSARKGGTTNYEL